ncbi:extracellular solute-binding protein [Jiangella alba]|uniref:Carbohydrate ABC transporter substrate-binding protein, CUT1 family n=1 Tax=Jiangella alba TaxID=561176 RepID=A0A1H5PN01_9ACTN|nr:extracellular solute-binding protein [Jiangella alba]SEF14598.1 carbohydrate ABC transporter substrate-binding protein, CUT1 family [Jiangella alba]
MKTAAVRWSALALTAGLVFAGCAQGTSDSSDDETGGSGTTFDPEAELSGELDVMGFGAGDEIGQTRVDLANAAIAPATVKLIEGDLDIQQFLSAIASGEPPELVYANRDQIGTFASRGAIIPLDACIDGEGIDTSIYREPALNQVTFDGSIYGIPEFNQVQITQANADLLAAAGLTLDDVNGSDWDAITAANQAMYVGSGGSLSVIGYDSKLPEFLPLWARANGADLLSEDGRTAQLDDPKVVEALEWAVGIYDAQGGFGTVKAYRDSADFFGAGNQFATNVLGAMPMEQWYVNVLNDVSPDAPMAFDTVRDREGEPLAYASGSAWAIPKGSENPEAACRFIKTMTETDSWIAAAQARVDLREAEGKPFTGLLTGNAEADQQIQDQFVTPSGDAKWDAAVQATYDANDHTFTLPANPADAEFKTAWQDAVNRVLNGQQEPADALAQAQDEAQKVLDEAWSTWDEREEG